MGRWNRHREMIQFGLSRMPWGIRAGARGGSGDQGASAHPPFSFEDALHVVFLLSKYSRSSLRSSLELPTLDLV